MSSDVIVKSIRIELRPHDFGDGGLMDLRINVWAGGMVHTSSLAVTEDDMTSRFDYYFDIARRELRDAIEKVRR